MSGTRPSTSLSATGSNHDIETLVSCHVFSLLLLAISLLSHFICSNNSLPENHSITVFNDDDDDDDDDDDELMMI